MNSQDKKMCAMGVFDHELYDEDYLGNLNMWDFPGEEGDGCLPDDFASKLGPIPLPSEMLGPVGADLLGFGTNMDTYEPKYNPIGKEPFKSQLKPQPPPAFSQQKNIYRIPKSFEAPSPDSVLERRSSTSSHKTVPFATEISIPVKTRTKRPRPSSTTNLWSTITLQKKAKKRRKTFTPQQQLQPNNENKKCSHCEITQTPQWREGPMGPKTLCNACGVRYRSGRLFPEYRPAASPTFIPSLHSNSHRKVIEMRQKGAGMDDDKFVVKKDFNSMISTNVSLCS